MGAEANYPWAKWCNGERWTLRHERDFSSTINTFKRLVATKAAFLHRNVSINRIGKYVVIQFGPPK